MADRGVGMTERSLQMAPDRHVFVVNPIAGGGTDPEEIRRKAESLGIPFEVYVTRGPKDASRFVRQRAATGEHLRFAQWAPCSPLEQAVGRMVIQWEWRTV